MCIRESTSILASKTMKIIRDRDSCEVETNTQTVTAKSEKLKQDQVQEGRKTHKDPTIRKLPESQIEHIL